VFGFTIRTAADWGLAKKAMVAVLDVVDDHTKTVEQTKLNKTGKLHTHTWITQRWNRVYWEAQRGKPTGFNNV
jgi:hypothetical protein